MKKAHYEHEDPQRFPKVFDPLEKQMIKIHEDGMKRIIVNVTKLMVKQKGNVHTD
jgi:hypothetical protein